MGITTAEQFTAAVAANPGCLSRCSTPRRRCRGPTASPGGRPRATRPPAPPTSWSASWPSIPSTTRAVSSGSRWSPMPPRQRLQEADAVRRHHVRRVISARGNPPGVPAAARPGRGPGALIGQLHRQVSRRLRGVLDLLAPAAAHTVWRRRHPPSFTPAATPMVTPTTAGTPPAHVNADGTTPATPHVNADACRPRRTSMPTARGDATPDCRRHRAHPDGTATAPAPNRARRDPRGRLADDHNGITPKRACSTRSISSPPWPPHLRLGVHPRSRAPRRPPARGSPPRAD
jgi:hypothetical protein